MENLFRYYRRLTRVLMYTEQHLADDLSLRVLADIAGLERTYFSVFFRSKVGLGVKSWVDRLRVERAAALLRESNWSTSELAAQVGFRHVRSLERAFRKHLGTTPREYKRALIKYNPSITTTDA